MDLRSSSRVTARLPPMQCWAQDLARVELSGLWQDGTDQQLFHCMFIPTFARCLSILVESIFLHNFMFVELCCVWTLSLK